MLLVGRVHAAKTRECDLRLEILFACSCSSCWTHTLERMESIERLEDVCREENEGQSGRASAADVVVGTQVPIW